MPNNSHSKSYNLLPKPDITTISVNLQAKNQKKPSIMELVANLEKELQDNEYNDDNFLRWRKKPEYTLYKKEWKGCIEKVKLRAEKKLEWSVIERINY